MAAGGDLRRVVDRVRQVREQRAHLVLALDVELVCLHLHAVFVLQCLSGLHAHQHLLRGGVGAFEIMAVVRGDEGDVHLPRKAHKPRQYPLLLDKAVILYLEEEIVLAEDRAVALGHAARVIFAAVEQQLRNVAG